MSAVLGKTRRTNRGFEIVEFTDLYDAKCSLQASSAAIYETPGISAVWLGPDGASPKVMAIHAASVGVKTEATEGWVPYPIPECVSLNTRMHLHRGQVKALIGHLQRWLEFGSFKARRKA